MAEGERVSLLSREGGLVVNNVALSAILEMVLLCTLDPSIVAIATDAPLSAALRIPVLDLNRPEHVVGFILETIGRGRDAAGRIECTG